MESYNSNAFDLNHFRCILDNIPVGVTVIDLEGRIIYYNKYSARIVDRKPEYIGKDIRSCHNKPSSIEKIDRILEEFKDGREKDVYYEAVRNGRCLAVTVSPFEMDGSIIGFIQSFIVKN